MKHLSFKFKIIILLMAIVSFISCDKELYEDSIIQSEQQIIDQTFKMEYLEGNDAMKIGNNLAAVMPTGQLSGRGLENEDYTVKFDQVMKVIDNLGNKTFMFRVDHPSATLEKFFNMVLQEKIDGHIYVRLMEYKMTPEFAALYNSGQKEIKEFEGEYFNKLISHHLGMIDEGHFYEGGDYGGGGSGGGGSSGGGDTSPGPGGTGGGTVIPTNNNGPGGNGIGSGNPCPEGGGSLGGGGGSSAGGGGGLGDTTSDSSCFILVGSTSKITDGGGCWYDLTALYVDCGGGANRGTGKTTDGDDPCPPGNGVAILEPGNMQATFLAVLGSSNYPAHNEFVYLDSSVKEIVLNYLYSNPNQTAINLAVSFFSSLYENGYSAWFSEQPINTQISIIKYLANNNFSQNSQIFILWGIDYLAQNPATTWDMFENQFMDTVEGSDGNYDPYWDDQNLTFPHQELPTWENFNNAFPLDSDPLYDSPEKMYNSLGGVIATFYSGPNTNTCAVRLSKALNYSGVVIPHIAGQTFVGDDGLYYFKAAYQINIWMRKTFGTNPSTSTSQYNANHHQYTQSEAGIHGVNLPSLLNGMHGIYSIFSSDFAWASGHADLLNDNATCGNHCLFYEAPIYRLDVWELP